MHTRTLSAVALAVLAVSLTTPRTRAADTDWPQWRGPNATGVAPHADPPTEWSETQNVRWKYELPGGGHAAPIVWKDRVYVLAAIKTEKEVNPPAADKPAGDEEPKPDAEKNAEKTEPKPDDSRPNGAVRPGRGGSRGGPGRRGGRRGGPGGGGKPTHVYQFAVIALERKTGKEVWQKVVHEEVPHEAGHNDASFASSSPLTDGERLYAFFGSYGLYCLDFDGKVLWEKDLGDMHTRNEFGEGSSPALAGDAIIVNWDHEGDSFIVALDKLSGSERWRQSRDEPTSWNTPLVVDNNGVSEVIVAGTNRVRAYDVATGKVVWECGGLGANCIPTSVAANGVVYAMSGHREKALLAIRFAGAKGDLTDSPAVVWRREEGIPYVPSPLLYDDTLYTVEKTSGIFYAINATNGEDRYERQRLEGIDGVYASLVGASGRVYVVGRNGATNVLSHGDAFKVLASNTLDDHFDASPAIAGSELYLRGHKHLYCIARN